MANIAGLNVNQIVEISVKTGEHIGNYPSRVEDIQKDVILLAAPIKKSLVVPLSVSSVIQVSYFYQNAVYSFKTFIVERGSEPLPLLMVKKPSEVNRIQRRNFVRFDVNLPLKVIQLTESKEAPTSEICVKTVDVSGGGLSFKSQQIFTKDAELSFEVEIPDMGSVSALGRIVRICQKENHKNEIIYSVGFTIIDEFDRDKIIKFIFSKQRELRVKGLL